MPVSMLSSIMRVGARVLDGLLIIAGELHWSKLEGELVKLAGEAERRLVVFVVNRRARIDAHIEGFIDGQEEWDSVRDLVGGNFLVIHLEDAGASLAKAGAIVFEVEDDGMLARRERLLTFPAEAFKINEVVGEDRPAPEQVQAI